MSKKIFIIIIVALVLITIMVWGVLFLSSRKNAREQGADLTLKEFFPFGGSSFGDKQAGSQKPPIFDDKPVIPEPEKLVLPKLRKISSFPVAGATIIKKERKIIQAPLETEEATEEDQEKEQEIKIEIIPTIRYMEKANGHIYDMYLDTNDEVKIVNTTILKIHEAFWGNSGNDVVLRYLKDNSSPKDSKQTIETFWGELLFTENVSWGELRGAFLSQDIKNLVLSPDKTKIFYLQEFGDEIIGTVSKLNGSSKSQVFSSQFTEWLPQWAGDTILLTTQPSTKISGFLYALNLKTQNFEKVFNNKLGLTTLADPTGKQVLYSQSINEGLDLNIYNIKTSKSSGLGINTLPEKCVWSSKNTNIIYCAIPQQIERNDYPDSWYKGLVSFSDNLWKLNIETNFFELLANPLEISGEPIDGTQLFLNEDENYLSFINKKDSYLWLLELEPVANL